MAPVFSKLNRKDMDIGAAFRRARQQAPIPLQQETIAEPSHQAKIKITFLRNPKKKKSKTNPAYEKEVYPREIQNAEQFCNWRKELEEYIKNAPLKDVQAQFHGATQLLRGTSKDDWEAIIAGVDQEDEEAFTEAIEEFALRAMKPTALRDQKRYMRHMRKPKDMAIQEYISRIKVMRSYLPYLSGTFKDFEDDEFLDVLVNGMSDTVQGMMDINTFPWEDKSFAEVAAQVKKLDQYYPSSSNAPPTAQATPPNVGKQASTKNTPKKAGNSEQQAKPVCGYCKKSGHLEDKCWKKKKAEKKAKTGAEAHVMHSDPVDSDSELCENQPVVHSMDEELQK
jgi:hypothetical protein